MARSRTDEIFGVEGVHVLGVTTRDDGVLVLDVETGEDLTGCASCGVIALGHGRYLGLDVLARSRMALINTDETTDEKEDLTPAALTA